MAIVIELPKLGATMENGTLVTWLVQPGDFVEEGDPIAEVQTDKIVQEVEVEQDGYILATLVKAGDDVPVFTPIAYLGEKDEKVDIENVVSTKIEESKGNVETQLLQVKTKEIRRTPAARALAEKNNLSLATIQGSGPLGRIQKLDVEKALGQQIKTTPLAQKIIDKQKVNISSINGSGVNGKIRKKDVVSTRPIVEKNTSILKNQELDTYKISGMRKVIAENIATSFYTAPHVTLHVEMDVTEMVALRTHLIPIVQNQVGERLSYNEMLIKAVALTLERHPSINQTITKDVITRNNTVSIGVAVAIENGLVVPVIDNASELTLGQITKKAKELGRKARDGQLTSEAYQGSTFTISNLGMFAVDGFTPIINQPNTAILGIGRIVKKAVVIENEVKVRSMMSFSLSFDHRVIDGAPAAAFLTDLKNVIENPLMILI